MQQITAQTIAAMLGGTIEGVPEVIIRFPSKIEEATAGSICFLHSAKYYDYLYTTKAAAVLVATDFVATQPVSTTLIRVANVQASVALLLEQYGQLLQPKKQAVIHAQALVEDGAQLGANISIGAFSCISSGAIIGENSCFGTQIFIGENVKIGKNALIYAGVKIYHDCEIGDNCIIHANTVIGADGFGFVPQEDGSYKKIAHIGNVIIGNDVEIGANATIDRATMGSTKINNGVKLDNLVQIAHNVEIGENTVIASQTGIAGSAKIGKKCRIGGQVGIVGHITVADGTNVQGQSGIVRPVKQPNTALAGTPAYDYHKEQRSMAIVRQLPDYIKQLREMENRLRELEKNL
jgi:UDP-3-O-[3-hydroxymyristoyl] glucosamine N-acyltransferase